MHSYCIACKERYIYVEGDEECTPFICSYCFGKDMRMGNSNWARLRFRILNRDGFSCKYCGNRPTSSKEVILAIDHIVPFSKGGSNSESNLITVCNLCNYGKMAFDLTKEGATNVEEYLREANKKLGERIEREGHEQVETSQATQCDLANGSHVGEGNVQTNVRKKRQATSVTE